MTHPIWILPVDSSALVLMPCPGTKGVTLEASFSQLADLGVVAVVTALPQQELDQNNLSDFGHQVIAHGMVSYAD